MQWNLGLGVNRIPLRPQKYAVKGASVIWPECRNLDKTHFLLLVSFAGTCRICHNAWMTARPGTGQT